MAELIGPGRCPICGSPKARYSVSAKSLAVCTCNACNCQIFARSDRSDDLLRKNITPAATPAAIVEIDDAVHLAPPTSTAPPPPPAPPEPQAAPATAPPPPRRKFSWGVLAGLEQ